MLSKNVLAASLLLASFQAVFAAPQTATVSIAIDVVDVDDPESTADVNIQGEIAGVGSDGTTYVLSYAETYSDDDFPTTVSVVAETFTIVQAATHVSYSLVETVDSLSLANVVVCSLDGSGNGVCTEALEENDSYTTATDMYTISGSVLFYAAEITGSGATATASASTTSSGSFSTSNASSAKSSGTGSASGNSSTAASPSSSSSGASSILASSFTSVLVSLFGVAFIL